MNEVARFERHTRHRPRRQPSTRMKEARKALGKRIVQWRKEHAQTVQIGRSAPALLTISQQEVSALEARVAQLEADNAQLASDKALLEEELASSGSGWSGSATSLTCLLC